MPKKNPEREAKRQRHKELAEFLDSVGVSDVAGVQALFKDLVSSVLQNGLEGALEEELGYSKYDYRNKETDNSRNGYSEKTVRSSFGDIELSVPRDRKGDYEPQLVKKHQTSLSGDIEEKILSMYAKGMSKRPCMSLMVLRKSGSPSIRKSLNPGGKTGLIFRPISSTLRRCGR